MKTLVEVCLCFQLTYIQSGCLHIDSIAYFWIFSSLLGRSTWTPTNASMSFSNNLRRSVEMSEGKSFSRLLGRCFTAWGYPQQLPAIHSQSQAAEQCCLVLSPRQALYAVLEKCFLCWKHTKKWQTKGRLWAQCGVDWGHFSWRSFGVDLPRQWEWRAYGDANLMTLSPPCSYRPSPSSDAPPP